MIYLYMFYDNLDKPLFRSLVVFTVVTVVTVVVTVDSAPQVLMWIDYSHKNNLYHSFLQTQQHKRQKRGAFNIKGITANMKKWAA